MPLTITSDDGLLTLGIPAGVAREGVAITATAIRGEDLPDELGTVSDAAVGYRLEPDGLTFDEPITVTRIVDLASFEIDPAADGIPVLLLASRSSDGTWEWLDDLQVSFDGTTMTTSGQTTHFSDEIGFDRQVMITASYWTYEEEVGGGFTWELARIGPAVEGPAESRPVVISATSQATGDFIGIGESLTEGVRFIQNFTCDGPGTGSVGGVYVFGNVGLGTLTDQVGLPPTTATVSLWSPVTCLDAPIGEGELTVEEACIIIKHEPPRDNEGLFFSHLQVQIRFGGPMVRRVHITIAGANDGDPVRLLATFSGFANELGLREPGRKRIESVQLELEGGLMVDATDIVRRYFQDKADFGATGTFLVPAPPDEPKYGDCDAFP